MRQSLCMILALAGLVALAGAQPWIGPVNATGDALFHPAGAVVDHDGNSHLFFFLNISPFPPIYGDAFHIKYSPTGEVLVPVHRARNCEVNSLDLLAVSASDDRYIDVIEDFGSEWYVATYRFDYEGSLVDSVRRVLSLPTAVESVGGVTAAMDSQRRIHVLYGTYSLQWPAVVYARVAEDGTVEVGPDTVAYAQPYYHMRMSSAVNSQDEFMACYSNVDGNDQYLQALVVDVEGTVIMPPFNPLPDTSHLPGVYARIFINRDDVVVLQVSSNPPGPESNGRHELYRYDTRFAFQDCTLVWDAVVDADGAWGDHKWGTDGYDRILMVFETAAQDSAGQWRKHAFTWAYDYNLELLDGDNELPVQPLGEFSALMVACGPGSEAVWMGAKPYTSPYHRVYSWHRIVNPDCLAVFENEPRQAAQQPDIVVWPNPTWGSATVRFSVSSFGEVTLTLYNVLGQRISRRAIPVGLGKDRVSLDPLLTGLASGMYFVSYEMPRLKGVFTVTLQR